MALPRRVTQEGALRPNADQIRQGVFHGVNRWRQGCRHRAPKDGLTEGNVPALSFSEQHCPTAPSSLSDDKDQQTDAQQHPIEDKGPQADMGQPLEEQMDHQQGAGKRDTTTDDHLTPRHRLPTGQQL